MKPVNRRNLPWCFASNHFGLFLDAHVFGQLGFQKFISNSGSQSGDKLNALIQFSIFGAQMGMIWIPVGDPPGNNWSGGSPKDTNRLGAWLGVMTQSNGDQGPDLAPSEGDRRTAERHGKRFAEIVRQWKSEGAYVTERLADQAKDA